MSVRVRSLLAVTAVAAVLSHGLAGHGLPQMSDGNDAVALAAGLCVLLAAGLGAMAMARPAAPHTPTLPEAVAVAVPRPLSTVPPDGGARASPTALMRLRN